MLLKLSWRQQDLDILELCHNGSGKLISGNKTTQKKKDSATSSKAERSWKSEEHFKNTHGDVEIGDCSAGFGLI